MVLNACYASTENRRASVRKRCEKHAAHCDRRQAETESPVSLLYTSQSDEPAGLAHIVFPSDRRTEG